MASVLLPTTPSPEVQVVGVIDYGSNLRGPLGGASQRVNRLGNRWAVDVQMPSMSHENARIWSAALIKALRDGARWGLLQPDFAIGSPGTPLVAGPGQTGGTLDADGFSASYPNSAGQYFSIVTDSQRYLYMIATASPANGSGVATLAIEPLLRVVPDDNDTLEFAQPYIEGHLTDAPSFVSDPNLLAQGFSFRIEESR